MGTGVLGLWSHHWVVPSATTCCLPFLFREEIRQGDVREMSSGEEGGGTWRQEARSGGQMPTLGTSRVPLVPSCPTGRVYRQLDLRGNQRPSLLSFLQRPWQQTKQDFWVHFTASCDSEVMSCSRLVSGPYSRETDRAEVDRALCFHLSGVLIFFNKSLGSIFSSEMGLSEVQRQLGESSCLISRCNPCQAPILQS